MPEPTESSPATDRATDLTIDHTLDESGADPARTTDTTDTNVIDSALVARLREMEAHLEQANAWDVTPQIFLWQPPEMVGMRIPDSLWRRCDGHPAAVLNYLAMAWDDIWPTLHDADPDLFSCPPSGVALLSEGWALNLAAVADDPDKTAEYMRANDTRKVHAHPDRIEVRSFMAVDRFHRHVFLSRMRGQEAMIAFDAGEGLVLDAMIKFITHVSGDPARSPAAATTTDRS